MQPTDEQRILVFFFKFQASSDLSVVHLPHCTWAHQQDHILPSRIREYCAQYSPFVPALPGFLFSNLRRLRPFQFLRF